MIVFVAFLLCLGYGFDRFYLGGGEFFFPVGTLAALGVGTVSAVSSYYSGDRAVLLSTGAVSSISCCREPQPNSRAQIRQFDNVARRCE